MIPQQKNEMRGAAVPPAPTAPESTGLELGDVLRILSERRKIVLAACILGLVFGLIASLVMTPLYRASTLVELNSQANEVFEQASGGSNAPQQRPQSQELIATQSGLLRSESLARRVVEDLNLAAIPEFGGNAATREQRVKRAIGVVQRNTFVEGVKNSLLINVSYSATDPVLASRVANGLADGFIANSLERRYDSSSYARQFLNDQLARTKAALEESERALNNYALNSSIFRTPGQFVDGKTVDGPTLATASLGALNEALNEARVQRIRAEQDYKNGATGASLPGADDLLPLIQERAKLQSEYDQNLKLFKPDYPQMQEISARIARIDNVIAAERSRRKGGTTEALAANYRAALQSEGQIEARLAQAKGEVQSEQGRSIQYNILQREADTNRALYDALLQRYKEIGVAGGIGQSNVSLVDRAVPPQAPYRPNLPINLLLGLLLGLGVGIGAAFVVHLLFDHISEPNDVRQKLHLPVLGVIPMEREDRTLMEALSDRKSDVSEAYYSVRTALRFSRPEGIPRTLLVTSTRPGEGKSTTAYAIASSIARVGSKVLLIDADMRKPTFISSKKDGYGLAHLLGSDDALINYVEQTQVENLSLLPVGRFVGSAAELLASTRLPTLIAEAQSRYDMVVLDGPPVLGLSDAPLLGAVAEATVLVIESRAARTNAVMEMIRRLHASGTNIIGVVLTKAAQRGNGYGYNYYSYTYGNDGVGGRVSSDPDRVLNLNEAGEP
jgi:polysaccharide biosynthesis transport protein